VLEGLDKAREDFFSEAQELVETFSRCLASLDEQHASGGAEPALINEAFRAVHTLKSLSALFGAHSMSSVSHRLEDTLDQLRLAKVSLSREVLDVLFQAVDLYWQLLGSERQAGDSPPPTIDNFINKLHRVSASNAPQVQTPAFDFDPGLLAVLTEYEEHRLRSCVEQGARLYRVRVCFKLATIDQELEDIKARAKPLGEVVTYLPTGESANADSIDLDLLLASSCVLRELEEALAADNVVVTEVPKRRADGAEGTTITPSSISVSGEEATDEESVVPGAPSTVVPAAAIRSISQTVRVDIRKLDALMNSVGELALVKSALSRISERIRGEGHRQLGSELHRLQRNFDRRLGELQGGILEVRMVPLSQIFDRLTRVVRQISRELDKDVRLVITGGETEIDKLLVEELSDPLMHIVRNAIDHGLESREKRLQLKKPEAGTLALNAFQKGNHVVLEIEDDGGGVDEQALIQRAIRMGRLAASEAEGLSREEALNLVFLPGLSTRETASDYSGRGVGMDVVKTNIGKLGGVVDLHSETSVGTRITVTLPITLAIVSSLLVRCVGRVFALPLTSVTEALTFEPSAVKRVDKRELMTLRGASLPLCRLVQLFELPRGAGVPQRQFVVVTAMGNRRLGLVVDELLGQQDIVIKALGPSLSKVRGFAGASELGDERVALVLDVAAIIEEVLTGSDLRESRDVGQLGRAGDHADR
jgi:two-component system, chemotaxis family, sensor kinase CheA